MKKINRVLLLPIFAMMYFIMYALPAFAASDTVSDLNINGPSSYTLETNLNGEFEITFSGIGIDSIGVDSSGNGLEANIVSANWNPYPNACSATIRVSSSENFSEGTVNFYLFNNNVGVIMSQSIPIFVGKTENVIADLNIWALDTCEFIVGEEKEITVNFAGQGINRININVSGEGLLAQISDVSWKAYPEICSATITVAVSKECYDGEAITFQLINNNFGVIKSKDIQIKTYTKPVIQESPEQDKLEEITLPSGIYIIRSKVDGNKVLDVLDFSNEDNAQIQLWSNYGTLNQMWYIRKNKDGYHSIIAVHSKKYLDVAGGGSNSGTIVQQYSENETDAQKWKIYSTNDGYVYIEPKCAPGLFLDVKNGSSRNGTKVQVYKKNYSDAQKWNCELVTKSQKDTKPITFKSGIIIDSEFEVSAASDVQEGIRSDLEEMLLETINSSVLKNINNFNSFIDEGNNISKICGQMLSFSGSVEVPQAVAVQIRKNNFKNLNGMEYVIEDDNTKITYITYVYPFQNSYSFAMFEVTETKSWNSWKINKIRLAGGFDAKVL